MTSHKEGEGVNNVVKQNIRLRAYKRKEGIKKLSVTHL